MSTCSRRPRARACSPWSCLVRCLYTPVSDFTLPSPRHSCSVRPISQRGAAISALLPRPSPAVNHRTNVQPKAARARVSTSAVLAPSSSSGQCRRLPTRRETLERSAVQENHMSSSSSLLLYYANAHGCLTWPHPPPYMTASAASSASINSSIGGHEHTRLRSP